MPLATTDYTYEQGGGQQRSPKRTQSALKGRSEFGFFTPFSPMGWEVQSPQPPVPRNPHKFEGTVARGDDGNEASQINFINFGREVQPPQPPLPRSIRVGGAIARGDDGDQAKFVPPPPTWAYDILQSFRWPFSPGAPGPGKVPEFGDPGNQASMPGSVSWGYDPLQQAYPPPPRKITATKGRSEFAFFAPSAPFGWETQGPALRWLTSNRGAGIDGNSQFAAFTTLPWWEVNADLWKRPPRLLQTVTDLPLPLMAPTTPLLWGHEIQTVTWRPRPNRSPEFGDAGNESPFVRWFVTGWEVQPPQPPYPRPERSGAIMVGDPGDENVFSFIQLPPTDGWEIPWPFAKLSPAYRAAAWMHGDDGNEGRFAVWYPTGWEVAPHQPQHVRYRNLDDGDGGIEAPFVPPPSVPTGYDIPVFYRARPHFNLDDGDPGIEGRYVAWLPIGWEIQPPPPPHPKALHKECVLDVGDSGTEAAFIRWFNIGWEIAPPLTAHEYFINLDYGIDGTPPLVVPFPWGWDEVTSMPVLHRHPFAIDAIPVLAPFVFVPPPASPVAFRKTFAEFGTGVGKRQLQD